MLAQCCVHQQYVCNDNASDTMDLEWECYMNERQLIRGYTEKKCHKSKSCTYTSTKGNRVYLCVKWLDRRSRIVVAHRHLLWPASGPILILRIRIHRVKEQARTSGPTIHYSWGNMKKMTLYFPKFIVFYHSQDSINSSQKTVPGSDQPTYDTTFQKLKSKLINVHQLFNLESPTQPTWLCLNVWWVSSCPHLTRCPYPLILCLMGLWYQLNASIQLYPEQAV